MASRASVLKHPIHPMLVPFPIGLWIFSLLSDIIYGFGWGGPIWNDIAFYTMAGGIVGGLAAAVPGLIDYWSLTDPEPARLAKIHMILNVTIVGLFLVNLWLRTILLPGATLPVILSAVGVAGLSVSGWLGGELVYVHGVAVESPPGANKPKPTPRTGVGR
jgi:uncharacterized membrane protein